METLSRLVGGKGWGGGKGLKQRLWVNFWGDGNVLKLTGDFAPVREMAKNH